MSYQDFCNKTGLETALIEAVVNQSGGWEEFTTNALDIATHIDGGIHGWITYDETNTFAEANLTEILDELGELAENMGIGKYELISAFPCLECEFTIDEVAELIYRDPSKVDSHDRVVIYNALAWFAAESVAQAYQEYLDDEAS